MSASRCSIAALAVTLLTGIATSSQLSAQTFSLDGLDGITFTTSTADYDSTLTDSFNMFGLPLQPRALSVGYRLSERQFVLSGTATLTIGGNPVDVTLGGSTDGLVVEHGGGGLDLISAQLEITSDMDAHGTGLTPRALILAWHPADEQFGISGQADLVLADETLRFQSGDATSPGILIESGEITRVELELYREPNGPEPPVGWAGLPMNVSNLGFRWESDQQFSLWGAGEVGLGVNEWDVSFGDSSTPGVTFEGGQLVAFAASVSSTSPGLDLGGAQVDADWLVFSWDRTARETRLSGSGTMRVGTEWLTVQLGDMTSPGLLIQDGDLASILMIVNGDLDAGGTAIALDDVTMFKQFDPPRFEMTGTGTLSAAGNSLTLHLGTDGRPGIVLEDGDLIEIEAGISGNMDVGGTVIESDGLIVAWSSVTDSLFFWGNASFTPPTGRTTAIEAGDGMANPGIAMYRGEVQRFQVAVTSDLEVASTQIQTRGLGMKWERSGNEFGIFGAAEAGIGDKFVEISLGTPEEPGLVFSPGDVKRLEFAITSDIEVGGLNIVTDALTYRWEGGTTTHIFGGAGLLVAGNTVDTDFGDRDSPGLIFRDGALSELGVKINSGISIGGVDTVVEDLYLHYAAGQFEMRGLVGIQVHPTAPRVSIDLGSEDQAGLIIRTAGEDQIELNEFTILIEELRMGSMEMRQLAMHFNDTGFIRLDLSVVLQNGSLVTGYAQTVQADGRRQLDEVYLDWTAPNLLRGIRIASGLRLYHLSGKIENISGDLRLIDGFPGGPVPSSGFSVAGTVGLSFLGASVAGKSAAFIQMEATAEFYDFGILLTSTTNLGAINQGGGWEGLLGTGSGKLSVLFDGTTKFNGQLRIPRQPGLTANLNARLSGGVFDASGKFNLKVPNNGSFPRAIRGRTFGQASGRIKFVDGRMDRSFARATFNLKTRFRSIPYTVEWRFDKLARSGANAEPASRLETRNPETVLMAKRGAASADDWNGNSYGTFFTLEENEASAVLIEVDWGSVAENAYVKVSGPDGYMQLESAHIEDVEDGPENPLVMDMSTMHDASRASFLVVRQGSQDSAVDTWRVLPRGSYTVWLTLPGDAYESEWDFSDIEFSITPLWQLPRISATGHQASHRSYSLSTDYWSHRPDSASIDLFRMYPETATDSSEADVEFVTALEAGSPQATVDLATGVSGESVWFVAMIDDGVNQPVLSEPVGPFDFEPDVSGQLAGVTSDLGTSLVEGRLVYLDLDGDGSWDLPTDDASGEPSAAIGAGGTFSLSGIPAGACAEGCAVRLFGAAALQTVDTGPSGAVVWDGTPQELLVTFERAGS